MGRFDPEVRAHPKGFIEYCPSSDSRWAICRIFLHSTIGCRRSDFPTVESGSLDDNAGHDDSDRRRG
jgi:hypothetical protein